MRSLTYVKMKMKIEILFFLSFGSFLSFFCRSRPANKNAISFGVSLFLLSMNKPAV
jgi:hypothetical protein